MKLQVSSWNVLADCYMQRQTLQSFRFASDSNSIVSSMWAKRSQHIASIFEAARSDIYCLQEVDHDDFYREYFCNKNGYNHLYLQRPTKSDGCFIAYNSNKLELCRFDNIQLNDLSVLDYASGVNSNRNRFLKHNVAQIAEFKCRTTGSLFTTINCHIHWNPNLKEVKFAQVKYILDKLQIFNNLFPMSTPQPVLFCGDFNSFPNSEIYSLITSHLLNNNIKEDNKSSSLLNNIISGNDKSGLKNNFPLNDVHGRGYLQSDSYLYGPGTKFLCDSTLIKLARWMRVLGVDCAMHVDDSSFNVKPNYNELFNRAKHEKRILLTTSRNMRERAACPQSFLVQSNNLEQAIIGIYREYGLELDKTKFLTVCGKCGGDINEIDFSDVRLMGKIFPSDRSVFACINCAQPYWWNEDENSSPAKAMKLADYLHDMISDGLKSFHEKEILEKEIDIIIPNDENTTTYGNSTAELSSMFKLRDEIILKNKNISSLKYDQTANNGTLTESKDFETSEIVLEDELNSYSNLNESQGSLLRSVFEEEPLLTNWNGNFSGTLDYIFISNKWDVLQAEVFPDVVYKNISVKSNFCEEFESSFHTTDNHRIGSDNNILNVRTTESLPNNEWPSDHLMLTSILHLNIN
eukprot:gene6064-8349_t